MQVTHRKSGQSVGVYDSYWVIYGWITPRWGIITVQSQSGAPHCDEWRQLTSTISTKTETARPTVKLHAATRSDKLMDLSRLSEVGGGCMNEDRVPILRVVVVGDVVILTGRQCTTSVDLTAGSWHDSQISGLTPRLVADWQSQQFNIGQPVLYQSILQPCSRPEPSKLSKTSH